MPFLYAAQLITGGKKNIAPSSPFIFSPGALGVIYFTNRSLYEHYANSLRPVRRENRSAVGIFIFQFLFLTYFLTTDGSISTKTVGNIKSTPIFQSINLNNYCDRAITLPPHTSRADLPQFRHGSRAAIKTAENETPRWFK